MDIVELLLNSSDWSHSGLYVRLGGKMLSEFVSNESNGIEYGYRYMSGFKGRVKTDISW